MRPIHVLLFLILVFGLAIGAAAIWPKDGLPMTREWSLKFASLDEFFSEEGDKELNLDSLLASYEVDFDSTAIKDSLRVVEIEYRQRMMRIQYPDTSIGLWGFFKN